MRGLFEGNRTNLRPAFKRTFCNVPQICPETVCMIVDFVTHSRMIQKNVYTGDKRTFRRSPKFRGASVS
jgi:hypothetical protein